MKRFVFAGALLVAAGLGLAGAVGPATDAQDKDKAKAKVKAPEQPAADAQPPSEADAQLDAEYVENLAAADRLAAAGRDAKSPEMLIGAGAMYLKLAAQVPAPGVVKEAPTGEKGDAIADKPLPPPDLKAEAAAAFKEARGFAGKDAAAVNTLIAAAEARKYPTPTRGAVGGPKVITRGIGGGITHTYNIPFFTGIPAALGVRTSGIRIRCHMATGNYTHFEQVVRFGNYTWVPKVDGSPTRMYSLTIRNVDNGPGQYTLTTN